MRQQAVKRSGQCVDPMHTLAMAGSSVGLRGVGARPLDRRGRGGDQGDREGLPPQPVQRGRAAHAGVRVAHAGVRGRRARSVSGVQTHRAKCKRRVCACVVTDGPGTHTSVITPAAWRRRVARIRTSRRKTKSGAECDV
eukprot:5321733-Prymnesium_polylepis.3